MIFIFLYIFTIIRIQNLSMAIFVYSVKIQTVIIRL